jgi:hypothetical protein
VATRSRRFIFVSLLAGLVGCFTQRSSATLVPRLIEARAVQIDIVAIAQRDSRLYSIASDGAVAAEGSWRNGGGPQLGSNEHGKGITMVASTVVTSVQLAVPAGNGAMARLDFRDVNSGKLTAQLELLGTREVIIADLVSAQTATTSDLIVVGSFRDSMRIGSVELSSAGGSDGFYARIDQHGKVRWAFRFGGTDDDQLDAVAAHAKRQEFAIVGQFTRRAEWNQRELVGPSRQPGPTVADAPCAVVAVVDAAGGLQWTSTFGGEHMLAIGGVALLDDGRVVAGATVRGTVQWQAGTSILTQGAADGVVVWYSNSGALETVTQLGGSDYDGVTDIAAVADNNILVAGWCSGTCTIGNRSVQGSDGDAGFIARLGQDRNVTATDIATSDGHEWIGSLSLSPDNEWCGLVRSTSPVSWNNVAVGSDRAWVGSVHAMNRTSPASK